MGKQLACHSGEVKKINRVHIPQMADAGGCHARRQTSLFGGSLGAQSNTLTCRPRESNQQPFDNKTQARLLSHSRPSFPSVSPVTLDIVDTIHIKIAKDVLIFLILNSNYRCSGGSVHQVQSSYFICTFLSLRAKLVQTYLHSFN